MTINEQPPINGDQMNRINCFGLSSNSTGSWLFCILHCCLWSHVLKRRQGQRNKSSVTEKKRTAAGKGRRQRAEACLLKHNLWKQDIVLGTVYAMHAPVCQPCSYGFSATLVNLLPPLSFFLTADWLSFVAAVLTVLFFTRICFTVRWIVQHKEFF